MKNIFDEYVEHIDSFVDYGKHEVRGKNLNQRHFIGNSYYFVIYYIYSYILFQNIKKDTWHESC